MIHEIKTAIEEIGSSFESYKRTSDARIDALVKVANANLEEARRDVDELRGRVETFESKGGVPAPTADRGGVLKQMANTLAESARAGKEGGKFEFKATLREIALATKQLVGDIPYGASPGGGYPVQAQRLSDIWNDPRRALRLIDVLPHRAVSATNAIEGVQLGDEYSPNAAIQQGEGAGKSETTIPTQLLQRPLLTFATHSSASRQVLSDVPGLQSWLAGLLAHGVMLSFEDYVINDSTFGLINVAQNYSATATPPADQIGEAAAFMQSLGWNPNIALVNPLDLFAMRSERASGGGDEQYVTPPYSPGTLWGLTPITTPALTAGTAIVIDSSQCVIFDRELINVLTGYVSDNFIKNVLTILVEARFGFALTATTAAQQVSIGGA